MNSLQSSVLPADAADPAVLAKAPVSAREHQSTSAAGTDSHGNANENGMQRIPPRRPRIAFGVMSAVAKRSTVEQLARSLAPHSVVIHHDYSQQPDFDIRLPHVQFVPNPRKTAYASWVWPLGVLHLLRHCVESVDFDYFQLMSPACLPIKPVAEFQRYLATSDADCNLELLDMSSERDAMMTFGHRLYAPDHSIRRALLRRARSIYFGATPRQLETAGLAILTRPGSTGQIEEWKARAGLAVTSLAKAGLFGIRAPEPGMRMFMGAAWFGVSRRAAEYLVRKASEPKMQNFFGSINDVGETMFPTLIGNSGFKLGPINHYTTPYNHSHPRWIGIEDLDCLDTVPAFFARKFPDDPDAEVRQRLLAKLMAPKTAIAT